MKKTLFLMLFAAMPVFAGTTSKQVIEPAPAPSPSLWSWFAGGSVGYLLDLEEPIYHLHLGVDSPHNLGGWDIAYFLEVGYFEYDDSFGSFGTTAAPFGDFDLEVVPITANVKFERAIGQRVNVYLGAGLGVALVDAERNDIFGGTSFDDNETVFAAQVFGGIQYDVSDAFELYTGVRWLHIDDTENYNLGDDVVVELGARFNF